VRSRAEIGRLAFIPFSVAAGLAAGFLARKAFDLAWGVVDDAEPPEPGHRDVSWGRMLAAAALEGAAFATSRAVADHAARIGYARLTGRWPGADEPDPT
jgi:hypothetical protein